jgi:hypothetical protein
MKTYPDLTVTIRWETMSAVISLNQKIGTHRINIQLVEQLRFEASFGRFSFTIDEPKERGGTDTELPPLAYFLAGAAHV